MSFSARHEAVLEDGRHLLLLDDRGWSYFAPAARRRTAIRHERFPTSGP